MKRLTFLFVLILFIGVVSAVETDIKESYKKGENMIIEIKGNILERIDKGQVDFLRGHVSAPFEYDIKKLGDRYFLWAITPAPEEKETYTLKIDGIVSTTNGKISKTDYESNFSVGQDLAVYSVNPGFIWAKEDFEVIVQLNEDSEMEIDADLYDDKIKLKPGKNIIKFSVEDFFDAKLNFIKIGDYDMPAYVIGKRKNQSIDLEENNTEEKENSKNQSIDLEENNTENNSIVNYYCSELSGEICSSNQKCSGESVQGLDGSCCIGKCSLKEKKSKGGLLWGILIIIFVIIALGFLWSKYKKAKNKSSLDKIKNAPKSKLP